MTDLLVPSRWLVAAAAGSVLFLYGFWLTAV